MSLSLSVALEKDIYLRVFCYMNKLFVTMITKTIEGVHHLTISVE